MDDIILHSTSLNDLRVLIGEVVEEKLHNLQPQMPSKDESGYLTRHEVCNRLRISLTTLHTYTKDGTLKGYKIGGRILYRAEEVEESIQVIQASKYKHGKI
jgi:excisionase family DNA binding protein